jgi:hypothetical protein
MNTNCQDREGSGQGKSRKTKGTRVQQKKGKYDRELSFDYCREKLTSAKF